jgi:hypothetical protein
MPDSGAIDAAVITKLQADAALMAIAVDGIYFDIARHGATRFVLMKRQSHEDIDMFNGAAFEEFVYSIQAVTLNTTGADTQTAAGRIQVALQDAALTATGYTVTRCRRIGHIRYQEADDDNMDARWQNWGGLYSIWASPA